MIESSKQLTQADALDRAYANGLDLTARQRLYDYQRPQFDLPGMVLEHTVEHGGTWIDVGCGNGLYLERIRSERPDVHLLGIDRSASLLAPLPGTKVCADAIHLPLRGQSTQVVLAMHMLYHLPDPDRGLAEFARVLAPGGLFFASTNARSDKQELDDLWVTAAAKVLGRAHGPRRVKVSDHFPLEEAADACRRHFHEVKTKELKGIIEVNSPEPILAHLASYRAWSHQVGVPFTDTLEQAEKDLIRRLTKGPFTITTHQGIVIASKQIGA